MPKVIYGWTAERKFKVSAQIIGETLEAIEKDHGGVTPAVVVDEARPITSVLHPFFEWDDSVAAENHRREQARALVQAVVVKAYDNEETRSPTRAFVSVMSETDGRSYVGIATAMSNTEMREQVFERARSEIEDWRNRYWSLQEFAKVFEAIDKSLPKAPAKRGRQRQVAAA